MAYIALNKSGCGVRKGNVKIRLDFFLDPTDPRYDDRYLYLVDVTSAEYLAGYPGKVDEEGNPIDQAAYDLWLESLPRIWENTPFHSHFAYFGSDVTQEDIKAEMEFHLPNFLKAFQERKDELDGGMRHGWATEKRIRPTDYSKTDSIEDYASRVAQCRATVDALTEFSHEPEAKEGKESPATAIDIGDAATDRGSNQLPGNTLINIGNPANDTGTIDTFEIWVALTMDGTNKVGTFHGSGTDYTNRDGEAIGEVASGAKRTFTGLTIDVTSGDFAGTYYSAGRIEKDLTGGSNMYALAGDQFGTGQQTYSVLSADVMSLYGTGETAVSEVTVGLGLAVTASLARSHGSPRAISVGLSATSSLARSHGSPRAISPNLSAAASVSRAIAKIRDLSASLTGAVSLARSRNRDYSISPSLTVATTISKVLAWTRTTASAITAELSITRTYGRLRTVSVGLSGFLTIINRLANEIAISCGLVVSTSVSLVRGFTRTLAASSTVATSISKLRGWTEVMAASLKLSTAIATLYEYYITSETLGWPVYGAYWDGQTFTPSVSHEVTNVKLKLHRTGSPGTITGSIRATDGSGHPTGGDLCSGTTDGDTLPTGSPYEWRKITFDTSYQLSQDVKYAIVVRAPSGDVDNDLRWRANCMLPSYAGGCMEWSDDSGSSWSSDATCDFMFEEWNETPTISRVVGFVRSSASALRSISSFSAVWSGVTDTLVTIAAGLTVASSIAYRWVAKRTVSPGLTLTAAISRTVTKTRSVAVSLTAAVSFLINEAVGRALKVITTVSHVFSIKTVASHVKKIITREGD